MSKIEIRRIKIEDATVLSELARKTFYDTFTGTCSDSDMQEFLFDYFRLEQVEKEILNEENYFYFAEIGGRPVGYIRFMEDYSTFLEIKRWKSLELKKLYILRDFHGQGVAQVLMDLFLKFAIENNFEVVWLGVWDQNFRAQKFYQKYGFENTGYSHNFPIGTTPQIDWWFWRFLKGKPPNFSNEEES